MLWAALVFAALGLPGTWAAAQQTRPTIAATVPSRRDALDINTATPQQLKALPGMGDEYVRRIIAGRPYSAKNQLVGRGVLPSAAYDKIAARIVAHRPK
jgi:DNA uptake protein ComE-like DNA-binding protein